MKPQSIAALVLLGVVASLPAQTTKSVSVSVKETAGIRRTAFPINLRVPFPRGSLQDPAQTRLLFNQAEVPAQFTAETRFPDGSIQWLDADFNSTIGPLESQTYQLEYGPGVKAGTTPRGLALTEGADAIQAGTMRFSKTGSPLVLSVKYRGEMIGSGENGLAVTDDAGKSHNLADADALKVEIVKRGPLYVVLQYSGRITIDANYRAPFVIRVEMPNSKAWVKVDGTVEDPGKRLREISIHTPLALGAFPWVWDFGTDRWTYGSLRNAADSVILTEVVKPRETAEWNVVTGPKGQEQLYDTARSAPARWGHVQDGKEVVAFAIESPASQPGTHRISMNGEGQLSFRFAPPAPAAQHRLVIYEHFVTTPVQIGAATSPSSILNPVVAVCDRQQYVLSGVQPPRNAEVR